jgi:adenylate kinase
MLPLLGGPLDAVLLLEVPQQVLVTRALGRGRADDEEGVVRERLRQYEEKTAPLVGHYEDLGLLRRIDGNRTMDEVTAQVLLALGAGV